MALLVFVLGLASATSVFAQPATLIITKAVADLDAGSLFIDGNFGTEPTVFLGETAGALVEQSVVVAQDTFIEIALSTTEPGTYLLVVTSGSGPNHSLFQHS